MSDREALLAAIIAQPAEDTPRLMYADWLQENGQQERAEFIRAQVWGSQAEPFSPQAIAHAKTAARLFEGRRGEWTRHLLSRVLAWDFARGFVEHLQVNVAIFPAQAAALFAAEPIRSLEPVRFASTHGVVSLAPFFETPQLERVTKLDLYELRHGADYFDLLTACRRLINLTDLSLRNNPVHPGWLETLLLGPTLPALAGLDLSDAAHLGPRLATVLPRADNRAFRRLNLNHIRFTSDEIGKVLESRCLSEVEELRLAWLTGASHLGPLTHRNLGWAIPWDRLRLLDLTGQGVSNSGIGELVWELRRQRDPPPLRWLGLANNGLGPDAVRALIDSPLTLYYLDVTGNDSLRLSDKAALESRFPDAVVLS